ncbi:hypothetical protein RIF29_34294 [Crotalaria pallida]|uniref:RBR-type E3 ubiquitin transferase n=1 Tax=Crotalaria pallida TaxID=3830 RepID=A0AAN9HTG6_CROPI
MDSQLIDPATDDKVDEFDEDEIFSIMDNVEEKAKDDAEKFKITPICNFNILSGYGISRLQEADITNVSTVLSISRVTACLLLVHFDWSVTKVHEAWFDCEEKVRKAVGLIKEPQVCFLDFKILDCDICFESFTCNMMKSLGCGHPYCINCWKDYIDTKINEGLDKCLALKCPNPSCTIAVDGDMIHQFASEPNRNKYDQFLLRSYVEKNKNMKWCPGPDCEFAIVFQPNGVNKKLDVSCLCHYSFCWNCGEDAHSPVDCEIVSLWLKKVSESKNINWILKYAKQCPKCKIPIEKNEGCMHMKCKCGFQFCWLCLRDWFQCDRKSCNDYLDRQPENFQEKIIEGTKRKEAREYIDKYTYYYERWVANELSRKKASENMRANHVEWLSALLGKPESNFEFLNEAWLQVVESRRLLKWAYVYGYYLPENEKAKIEFFEYTQGEAEAVLERFHHYLETKVHKFLTGEALDQFEDFHLKLIDMTVATRNYFDNLVRTLENGLADVEARSYSGIKRRFSEM